MRFHEYLVIAGYFEFFWLYCVENCVNCSALSQWSEVWPNHKECSWLTNMMQDVLILEKKKSEGRSFTYGMILHQVWLPVHSVYVFFSTQMNPTGLTKTFFMCTVFFSIFRCPVSSLIFLLWWLTWSASKHCVFWTAFLLSTVEKSDYLMYYSLLVSWSQSDHSSLTSPLSWTRCFCPCFLPPCCRSVWDKPQMPWLNTFLFLITQSANHVRVAQCIK